MNKNFYYEKIEGWEEEYIRTEYTKLINNCQYNNVPILIIELCIDNAYCSCGAIYFPGNNIIYLNLKYMENESWYKEVNQKYWFYDLINNRKQLLKCILYHEFKHYMQFQNFPNAESFLRYYSLNSKILELDAHQFAIDNM